MRLEGLEGGVPERQNCINMTIQAIIVLGETFWRRDRL